MGEDGVHYNFVAKEQIQREIKEGRFIESAEVHGNYYGTSFGAVDRVVSEGKVCVLDIDVQGAEQVKRSPLDARTLYFFVRPPSMEELERRLRERGTEAEEKIKLRLENAKKELGFSEGRLN